MKRLATLIIFLLCATTLFAQMPETFSYQAVVRNASNALVTDAMVNMRVSILQGSATGNIVYVETHTASTNANGLLTVEIGGGKAEQGEFSGIDWANGPYFLKTETDPNGGCNYSVTITQQLLSVPYALYAREAANSFSGDYNDLKNKPVIPQNVGELTNDAGYITLNDLPDPAKGGSDTNHSDHRRDRDLQIVAPMDDPISDTKRLYYCFPQHHEDVVAKTRLAAEELFKLRRAEKEREKQESKAKERV